MSILALKGVNYKVKEKHIVQDVSFDIEEGDCVSIVGPSGSGKSTMLKLCADLLPLTSGNIFYQGNDYKTQEPTALRREISYCVQQPFLFGRTVQENVAFPYKIRKKKMEESNVLQMLSRFHLDASILNKEVKSLSGGEQQRIAMIRNLLFTPRILLLDEVTSALDQENAIRIENYMEELNEAGVTILWITHNEEQSKRIFNKRIVMKEGKVTNMEVLD